MAGQAIWQYPKRSACSRQCETQEGHGELEKSLETWDQVDWILNLLFNTCAVWGKFSFSYFLLNFYEQLAPLAICSEYKHQYHMQIIVSTTYGCVEGCAPFKVSDLQTSLEIQQKNPPCNEGDKGLIPGWGTKIAHATELLILYHSKRDREP